MASRRDQLQAHRFLGQRVHSALVIHETDPEQPPFRRPALAAWGSLALAVVALVAVGAYGFLRPGGNRAWQQGNAVIVVKETGARYVYLDQRLHPVLNYTSALLALGRNAPTRTVSRESLIGVPRGPGIGIPDAPDALPAANRLATGGWSLCSRTTADGTGADTDQSVLLAGASPAGATPLADTALLVEVRDTGDEYLLWRGHRHRIRQADTVTFGLALNVEPRARVSPALVDILPPGDAIAPISVRDAGKPSRAVPRRPGLRIGQLVVLQLSDGTAQHYLVEADRLRAITELQSEIQLAARGTVAAYPDSEPAGLPLSPSLAADVTMATTPASPAPAPAKRPQFAAGGGEVCVTYDDGAAVPRIGVGGQVPAGSVPTAARTRTGLPLADRIFLPPGRAVLAEVSPGTILLVTDQGRAFPLADRSVLGTLGYGNARPIRLPDTLVSRVPRGPGLGQQAALSVLP